MIPFLQDLLSDTIKRRERWLVINRRHIDLNALLADVDAHAKNFMDCEDARAVMTLLETIVLRHEHPTEMA